MSIWFFTIKHAHWRTGATAAVSAGVVRAATKEAAAAVIMQNTGTANAFGLAIEELTEKDNFLGCYLPVK